MIENLCFLDFLRDVGLSKFFLGGCILMFRSDHLKIHNLCDLVVILSFLCCQYRVPSVDFT